MIINYRVTNNADFSNLLKMVIRSIVLGTFQLLYLSSFFFFFKILVNYLHGNQYFIHNLRDFASLT